MGEILHSMFNDLVGNDKATQNAAKLPLTAAKSAIGLAIIPAMLSLR